MSLTRRENRPSSCMRETSSCTMASLDWNRTQPTQQARSVGTVARSGGRRHPGMANPTVLGRRCLVSAIIRSFIRSASRRKWVVLKRRQTTRSCRSKRLLRPARLLPCATTLAQGDNWRAHRPKLTHLLTEAHKSVSKYVTHKGHARALHPPLKGQPGIQFATSLVCVRRSEKRAPGAPPCPSEASAPAAPAPVLSPPPPLRPAPALGAPSAARAGCAP